MKLFLPAFLFFICLSAYAQDFTLVGSEGEYFLQAGELHKSKITIKNNSDEPLRLAVRILESDFDESVLRPNICLGEQCVQENGILEINTLEAGEILDKLSFSLKAGQQDMQGELRYLIFDTDNPSDVLESSIRFHIQGESPAGIMYQRPDMKISNAYPNPIVNNASIDYTIDSYDHVAKIMVMNLLGNKVMEFDLLRGQHNLKIPAEQLSNGIYFYTLQLDGKNVATRKIVVRK